VAAHGIGDGCRRLRRGPGLLGVGVLKFAVFNEFHCVL
jgi:hypothetical protein